MRVPFRFLFVPALMLLATSIMIRPAAAGHIDFINATDGTNFTLTSNSIAPVTTTPNPQIGANSDILGGSRAVTLNRAANAFAPVSARKETVLNGGAGLDVISFTSGPTGLGTLNLAYNGIANANFFSLWDGFLIDLPSLNNQLSTGGYQVFVSVAVQSSAGNGTSVPIEVSNRTVASAQNPNGLNVRPLFVDFLDRGFTDNNVDFSDVDGVQVNFRTGIFGSQFQVGSITRRDRALAAVPEPTALVMFGSTVAMGFFGRRRRSV